MSLFGALLASGFDYLDAEAHGVERYSPMWMLVLAYVGLGLAVAGVLGLVGGGIAARVRRRAN